MSPSAEGTALGSIAGDYDAILTQLRSDPAKLPKARRFLSVYLDGVADAGEKFAKLKTVEHRSGLDASFASFLDAAKETAAKQRAALVADDEFNLDVDLEVLRKRMTLEGV
jgi:5-bromo-4-chloroindolyl phosphate hydrolysis protein